MEDERAKFQRQFNRSSERRFRVFQYGMIALGLSAISLTASAVGEKLMGTVMGIFGIIVIVLLMSAGSAPDPD